MVNCGSHGLRSQNQMQASDIYCNKNLHIIEDLNGTLRF